MKWEQNIGPQPLTCYAHHSANILGDKMYIFGGVDKDGYATNELYEYSFSFDLIDYKNFNYSFKHQIHGRGLVILKTSLVLFNFLDLPKLFIDSRFKHSTCIHKNKLFVFGGETRNSYLNDIWSLDFGTEDCSDSQLNV